MIRNLFEIKREKNVRCPNVKIWLARMKVENKEISMIHTDNTID